MDLALGAGAGLALNRWRGGAWQGAGIFFAAAAGLWAADTPPVLPVDEFVKDWQISKQFTLEVAEKMPESDYGFKATPAEMSFGGLMVHIADSSVYRF